jgi:type I restriction enzyme S subunit
MEQAASTSGLYTLSVSKVAELPVPLPPLAEQEAIVAGVETLLADVTAAEAVVSASLTRAARLRQSILKEAFAGRLVPQDPADEPASALLERIKAAKPTATPAKNPRGRKGAPVEVNEAIVDLLAFAVPTALDAGKLNRTKIQKFAAVLQTHHGVEIVERFLQAPFGPYAPEIEAMEQVCVYRKYFATKEMPREGGGFEVHYAAESQAEVGRLAGLNRLGEHATDAEKLLRRIREMTTDAAELFATVYAVWNDLLLDGKHADDAAITAGVYAWNVKKMKFRPAKIAATIAQLRATGYVPTGRGKHTEATKTRGRKKTVSEPE